MLVGFVTLAAAVLSLGRLHMARGQGSWPVSMVSEASLGEFLLDSSGETRHCATAELSGHQLHDVVG